ncbi:MAG: recombinase family protein [Candidatus Paceibacterota bacterium]
MKNKIQKLNTNATKPPKAVVWCRVSSREQFEEGFTVDKQARMGKDYAREVGADLAKSFEVPESAAGKKERTFFKDMMDYLRKHDVKILICERVDRITRNFNDYVLINEWLEENEERQVHFMRERMVVHKNAKSDIKFRWDIHVVLAKKYSSDLSENIREGLMEKGEQGWYPGTHKAGYQAIRPDGSRRAIWIIDKSEKSEAPYIKKLFDLYVNTTNSAEKCRDILYEEGWTRRGKKVTKNAIFGLLADPFFCGDFLYKGKLYRNANHEPLVSREVWDRAQEKRTKKQSGKYNKHIFAYRGPWLVCGVCGFRITAEIQKGIVYYHHTHYGNCERKKHRWIPEKEMEKAVLQFLDVFEVLKGSKVLDEITAALKESHVAEMEYHNNAIKDLEQKYDTLQRRRDNLYIDKLDQKIPLDRWERLDKDCEAEQQRILNTLERHKNANTNYFELGAKMLEIAANAKQIFINRKKPEDKHKILQFLFSNLTLKDEKLSCTYTKPFQLIAERARGNDMWRWRESNPRSMKGV